MTADRPAYTPRAVLAVLGVLAAPFVMLAFGWLLEQAIRAMGGS